MTWKYIRLCVETVGWIVIYAIFVIGLGFCQAIITHFL